MDSTTNGTSDFFIGRDHELRLAKASLVKAADGHGGVMLVAGSAGIGKSRLARQIVATAADQRFTVHWARCPEEPGAPAYWPWRQLFRSASRNKVPCVVDDASAADHAIIGAAIPEALSPHVANDLSTCDVDTAQARFALFDAITRFWQRAATEEPVLLVFDDLHCADPTSIRLLSFFSAQLAHVAVMVLATYRDTEVAGDHPLNDTFADLVRTPGFRCLHLRGLDCRESGLFFLAASGAVPNASLAQALHVRTEGNPLFLQETVRYLIEDRARSGVVACDESVLLTVIPEGVRHVIAKRVRHLPEHARRLLPIASCIGRTFDIELLMALEPKGEEERVLASLEAALQASLLETTAERGVLRFSHVLIRDMLYEDLLAARRERLHGAIAEWLETRERGNRAPRLAQLAHHFAQAGRHADVAKALHYAREAAEQAGRSFAFEEASRLCRLALSLQAAHFGHDASLRCDLLLTLGRAEADVGAPEPSRAAFLEAAEVARDNGLTAAFVRAAIGFEQANFRTARSGEASVALLIQAIEAHEGNDAMRVELLACLSRAYVYCNLAEEAQRTWQVCVALARELGDARGLYLALTAITSAGYWPALLDERLAAGNEAWSIAQASSELRWTLADLMAYRLCDLFRVGDIVKLRAALDADRRVSRDVNSLYHQAVVLCFETLLSINEGTFDRAECEAQQALAMGERVAQQAAATAFGMQMFCIRREQGRLGEVLPAMQLMLRKSTTASLWRPGIALIYAELDMRAEARAEFDALQLQSMTECPANADSLTRACFAAEVCVYLEDASRAAALYRVLQPYEGATLLLDIGGPCLGAADRLLGMLATVDRRWEVAEQHFMRAMDIDERTGARVWLAHDRYRYARMLHARGAAEDRPRANQLIEGALADARALGMSTLVARVETLRAAIDASSAEPAYPCGLTKREVEVLRLVAIGRNNRDIGRVLEISSNTVANHIRSILDKTYSANRTEAAAFASHAGLLDA
ncbi:Transcriptional regulator, LuxR family (modular protein) [Burkholderia sp. 8Y]|uniref:helix-turn-helix transcriptional regulator n=1 Tax=Burkholderia sp. 8Y TaxID=2653133 RepID=UPI0012F010A7|nr:AAA family ATPase [Burkholderia sp. 8Y]VXC78636.1 Transcriptional regulator, LuxR family (modular protein) [Burkholderia sp. 8Y]